MIVCVCVCYIFGCISLTADGPQHARLPIPPTLQRCHPVNTVPVVTKDLPISPRFSPAFFIAMQVRYSYTSSANGKILFTQDLTLSATEP